MKSFSIEHLPSRGKMETRHSLRAGEWRVEILHQVNPDAWNASVADVGGSVFHNYYYSLSLYQSNCGKPFFARWWDDKARCVACCPGAIQWSRLWPFSVLFPQAHLSAFPACKGLVDLPSLLALLEEALAARGIMALILDSFGAPPEDSSNAPAPFAQVRRAEFRLALEPSLDELWGRLAGTRRTQIRRAQREGLVLRKGHTRAEVDQLGRLIAGSAQRWSQSHGQNFVTPPPEKLDRMARHLVEPGLATVYLAECAGGPLSGNLVGHFNGQAYNLLAGSSPEGFKVGAASWLYWEIIKDLKEQRVREFNLGGVAPDGDAPNHPARGLYDFKRDFGGRLVSCPSLTYVMRPGRYRWYQCLKERKPPWSWTVFHNLFRKQSGAAQ